MRLLNRLLDRAHGGFVHDRRTAVLSQRLAAAIPPGARVLDVGAGDGLLASRIADLRPDVVIEGVDVLVRPDSHIPVSPFDGTTLPFPDTSWDVVMLVDVVHHALDPEQLLAECGRVASRAVVIKDHLREGFAAETTLRFMDWVGNARHGVHLEYRYFDEREWREALERAGLEVVGWERDLALYTWPLSAIFGRGLHFVGEMGAQRTAMRE